MMRRKKKQSRSSDRKYHQRRAQDYADANAELAYEQSLKEKMF